jgi:hypothetical protein
MTLRRKRILAGLLACAVLYAAGWLVTARIGAPAVRRAWVSTMRPEFRDVSAVPHGQSRGAMPWYYCRVSCPCPFIVRVERGWMAEPQFGGGGEYFYFWCFGINLRVCDGTRWAS